MKYAVITGGSSGIGKGLVEKFASSDYRIISTYLTHEREAKALEDRYNGAVRFYRCDLSSETDLKKFVDFVSEQFSHVDVLINNAGISSYGLVQDVTLEEYDRLMGVNVKAPFILTSSLVGKMIGRGRGVILNVSSVWGQTGASCEVLYSTSKSALIGFTKALAKELAPSGISVNAIAPGVVDTPMMDRFTKEEIDGIVSDIPCGDMIRVESISCLALWLSELQGAELTGQIFGINGGMYC